MVGVVRKSDIWFLTSAITVGGTFYKHGVFSTHAKKHPVNRFRCKHCGTTQSIRTYAEDKYQNWCFILTK